MQVKDIDINTGKIMGYGICKKKSTTSHFLVVLPLRLTLERSFKNIWKYRVSWSGRTTLKLYFVLEKNSISLDFSSSNVYLFYLHQTIGSDILKYI